MRIANIVLNDFTRDNRVLKIASTLVSEGQEVTVVALYKRGLPRREDHPQGFATHRMRLLMPARLVGSALKFVELCLKVTWMYRRYDAWHCNDAEAFVIGLLAKFTRPQLKLIYDCHEFEAERNGKSQWHSRGVRWMERNFIRYAEEVIVVSPSIQSAYEERYMGHGLPPVRLVRNVPGKLDASIVPKDESSGLLRDSLGLGRDDFVALYQGAFTINRGIEELLELSAHLTGTHIHLVFMGYGLLENEVRSAADAFPNVHFQPAVPYEQVLQYTRDADVGLVSVRPICLSYLYCLPNKLFECIQAGVPVLVNELPDCVALVEEFEVGAVVRGESAQDWLHALQKLALQQPSLKETAGPGLQRAQSELNWGKEQTVLATIYHRIEGTQRDLTAAS